MLARVTNEEHPLEPLQCRLHHVDPAVWVRLATVALSGAMIALLAFASHFTP